MAGWLALLLGAAVLVTAVYLLYVIVHAERF